MENSPQENVSTGRASTDYTVQELEEDQDSLLVKRRNDNHSPGWVRGIKLYTRVPEALLSRVFYPVVPEPLPASPA